MLGNFSATLSGALNLALDAGIPEDALARELMRFARMLQPTSRERFAQPRERMSIDPGLDMAAPWRNGRTADQRLSIDPELDAPAGPHASPPVEPGESQS